MKKNYTIKMEGKDWEKCLDKSFDKKKKDINVDGFRKGNVPKDVYIKKFGVESLFMDAVDIALPELYTKLLSENTDIEPVCAPGVDIKSIDEKHLEVEFTIVEKPEVKLGKYKDLKIKKEEVKVTKDEIEHELGHLKEQFAELKVKESGSLEDGDIAVIDFEGFKDGVAFDGGKSENFSLTIGSNQFIPGFETGLIGMNKGEERELNLKFPEEYPSEELKGQDVVFKVKLNEIKERIFPEMDEEFFKDLAMPEVDSEEKLLKEIESNIKTHKERHAEDAHIEACLEEVRKNAKLEIPEEMTDEETDRMINEFKSQIAMQGIDFDTYLQMIQSNVEDLKKNFKDEANKRISYRLIIEAVSKKENIEVTDEEINEEIDKMCTRYNMSKEELIKNIGSEDYIKYDLQVKKALELIVK